MDEFDVWVVAAGEALAPDRSRAARRSHPIGRRGLVRRVARGIGAGTVAGEIGTGDDLVQHDLGSNTAAIPDLFAPMWGSAAVVFPALGVAPRVSRWGTREIVIDVFHHLAYAVAAGTTYTLLTHNNMRTP